MGSTHPIRPQAVSGGVPSSYAKGKQGQPGPNPAARWKGAWASLNLPCGRRGHGSAQIQPCRGRVHGLAPTWLGKRQGTWPAPNQSRSGRGYGLTLWDEGGVAQPKPGQVERKGMAWPCSREEAWPGSWGKGGAARPQHSWWREGGVAKLQSGRTGGGLWPSPNLPCKAWNFWQQGGVAMLPLLPHHHISQPVGSPVGWIPRPRGLHLAHGSEVEHPYCRG